jgi:hypothetical protein
LSWAAYWPTGYGPGRVEVSAGVACRPVIVADARLLHAAGRFELHQAPEHVGRRLLADELREVGELAGGELGLEIRTDAIRPALLLPGALLLLAAELRLSIHRRWTSA